MRNSNLKRMIEFRGDHPKFVSGECYSIADYVNAVNEDSEQIIKYSTLKGRLYGEPYCTPRHLKSVFEIAKSRRGYSFETRERVKMASRLENKSERMMAEWLKVKL